MHLACFYPRTSCNFTVRLVLLATHSRNPILHCVIYLGLAQPLKRKLRLRKLLQVISNNCSCNHLTIHTKQMSMILRTSKGLKVGVAVVEWTGKFIIMELKLERDSTSINYTQDF